MPVGLIEGALAHHERSRGLKSKLDMVRARIGTITPAAREVFELVVRGKKNKGRPSVGRDRAHH